MGRGKGRATGKGNETQFASSSRTLRRGRGSQAMSSSRRMEFTQQSAVLPSPSQTVTRGRVQGGANVAMATSQDLPFRPSTSVNAKPRGRSKHFIWKP
ncbi:hypothetical protein ACFX13_017744 [Malus domestica]|uniref:Uncharacterized protein n=1 Tax=Malus domestica TaxID=3750 RepID=A0A498KNH0_MALDO|nr:hypothetical protein DVH24_028986 [Malus domestica]RXI09680.1 hypothetical protein DVH24_017536 [Malus domestica]